MKGARFFFVVISLVFASCTSQVITMYRGSSGAVERDSDFVPIVGADYHYISFPAYPFVNCADPLVYDRLIDRLHAALVNFPLAQEAASAPDCSLAVERERPAVDLYCAIRRSALGEFAAGSSTLDGRNATIDQRFADDIGDLVDLVLKTNHAGTFSSDDLAPFNHSRLHPDVLADIQRLAASYGTSPCSSSLRYRDFLGYTSDDSPEVSWIDRTKEEQRAALQQLGDDLGVDPTLKGHDWPVPVLSFLHFSDVQIREPGAKLGGTELSSLLRRIEPSFEQDYVQELYALYGYDAIVKTANEEIDLARRAAKPNAILQRPAPTLMIHTGDSADTGMQSEFDSFVTYSNKLHVPWYQVIGNHDVLAFGNLQMSSVPNDFDHLTERQLEVTTGRDLDERCQGWGRIPCTCTDLNTIARTQQIRTPDNRGGTDPALPSPKFAVVPILLQRICLLHAVASDWFVMDPDKSPSDLQHNNPVDSFILSHCVGWHPSPSNRKPDADAALRLCMAPDASMRDTYRHYVSRPEAGQDCATLRDGTTPSTMHGFDTLPGFDPAKPAKPDGSPRARRNLGGNYCFEIERPEGAPTGTKAWAIVLNTNTDAGAYGYLSPEQTVWLRHLLLDGDCVDSVDSPRPAGEIRQIGCKDEVMVFSHHPIFAIYDQRQRLDLTDIVTRSPNVIAYIAGHTHNAGLRTIRPLRGSVHAHAKWEIVAPSVIDFPQAARQIMVKTSGDLGYLEVLTFTPNGMGKAAAKIAAASAGAVRDRCRSEGKCDVEGHALLPAREVTFPRAFFRTPAATRHADGE